MWRSLSYKILSVLLIGMFLSINSKIGIYAKEQTQVDNEKETETEGSSFQPIVALEPIAHTIIMRKDLKTVTFPVYMSYGSTITSIRTSQSNFKAEYNNGAILITAFNTDDYVDHSDIMLTLYIEGLDTALLPFSEELQVMIAMESKESVSEELNKYKLLDVSEMTPYNRTLFLNVIDKIKIAGDVEDFSGIKIACIGDSITEGVGLKKEEESLYSYPADLHHILNTKEIINLGKGGTSIASYWDSFFSITEGIPEDTDIILIMGGVNDCYSGNKDNMGNLENCELGTFYGDTNYLMQSLKERYPESLILFITPISTVTTTSYLSFLPNMLSLSVYAEAIKELGEKNGIPVFDIYSEEFLDSNDEEVMNNFMYDGVHPNAKGYYILAEHIAGKLIDMEIKNED